MIYISFEFFDLRLSHQLGHDRQSGLRTGVDHGQDAFGAHALEGVRARARLVCAASKHLCPGIFYFLGKTHDHLMIFHGARAADHDDVFLSADADAVDIDDGVFRMEHAVG